MASHAHRRPVSTAVLGAALLLTVSTACAPLPGDPVASAPVASAPVVSAAAASATPAEPSAEPSAEPTTEPTTEPSALPADCADLLTVEVAAALADVPLNDPAFGEAGELAGGGLLCLWRDPAADTTSLATIVQSSTPEQTAFARQELLAIEGGTCAEDADGGLRCEATWQNETYPVTDGRAMYALDGVRIDVQYSNLLPDGFLDSVIGAVWP